MTAAEKAKRFDSMVAMCQETFDLHLRHYQQETNLDRAQALSWRIHDVYEVLEEAGALEGRECPCALCERRRAAVA